MRKGRCTPDHVPQGIVILRAFDSLRIGEQLLLTNDHGPRLCARDPDLFSHPNHTNEASRYCEYA
jgi:uncharacterized protein (DUF2249 family)